MGLYQTDRTTGSATVVKKRSRSVQEQCGDITIRLFVTAVVRQVLLVSSPGATALSKTSVGNLEWQVGGEMVLERHPFLLVLAQRAWPLLAR
jgi:hypothetical protein